ncbi:MAG: hypothetical protein KC431_25830, partial [Myxococcales bacterium]|nr:hypothetical protein [Myxococcales bacterium]
VELGPREAWDAAEAATAELEGERELEGLGALALAAGRANLATSRRHLDPRFDGQVLDDLPTPALTWLENDGEGGTWLLVLGRRGRSFELVFLDEFGERSKLMTPQALREWLAQRSEPGAEESRPWLLVESRLPLAPLRAASQSKPRGKSPIRRLFALADLDRRELGAVAVYALAMGAMTLAVPVAVQALVNTVAFGTVLQPLVVLSLMLAMGLAFTATLRVLQTVVVERLQRRLFVRVATDFVRRLSRLSPAVRERYHGPELANRFFEVLTLQKAGAALLTDGLALALQLLVGTLLLAFYHPVLLAFDLALMLAVVGVIVLAGRGAVDSSLAESTRKYAVAAWLEEVAGGQRFGDAAGRRVADERGELLIREW